MVRRRLLVPALVPMAFIAGTAVSTAFTQQGQPAPMLVEVNYMKVDPNNEQDYLRLERELWKPVHQEGIRTGQLRSWTLYQVRYPFGTEQPYNYVTVNIYKSLADADRYGESLQQLFAKVQPKLSWQEVARRTFSARQLVRGDAWYQLEHVE